MTDRILFVGINAYPGAPLRGCVNDVKNMRASLERYSRIENAEIKTLLDFDATTENVKDAAKWLAGAPGRKFFHYSGHGAQVESELEPDGYLEVICPVDFDWSPEKMVTDKDFLDIFSQAVRGTTFTWVSDSCHSGGLDRGLPKFGAPVNCARAYPSRPPHVKAVHSRMKRTLQKELAARFDVGFISGCKSEQTSADTVIDGQPCGALTAFLLNVRNSVPLNTPMIDLGNKVRALLGAAGYDQEPQVDGTQSGLPFFA